MAQHRWNRRFLQDAEAAPDNLLYFEPDLARRRRYAERKRDQSRAEEIDRSGSARHLERAAKRLKHVDAVDRVLYLCAAVGYGESRDGDAKGRRHRRGQQSLRHAPEDRNERAALTWAAGVSPAVSVVRGAPLRQAQRDANASDGANFKVASA